MPLFFRVLFGKYTRRDGLVAALGALVRATILFRRGADLRMELSVGSFGSTRGAFDQQLTDLHEIVGEHRGAHKQFEALGALGEATLPAPKRWPSLATATLSSPMPADINILVYNCIIASRTNREVVCV